MSRTRLMKHAVALAFGLAACSPALAAGDGSLERLKKAGKLVIATDATYPPMEFEGKGGKIEGFDIDLISEVAARIGVKAEVQAVAWDGIIPGLFAKRYDTVISTMNITEERAKQVNFVEYARVSQLFIAKKGVKVASEKDLAGKVVVVQADTTGSEYADKVKKQGVAMKELKAIPGSDKIFEALKAGQGEVIIADEPVGRFYVKNDPATFEITGKAIEPMPIGIGVRKDDTELQKAIADAVDAMKKDGTIKKLSEKWFGGELGV